MGHLVVSMKKKITKKSMTNNVTNNTTNKDINKNNSNDNNDNKNNNNNDNNNKRNNNQAFDGGKYEYCPFYLRPLIEKSTFWRNFENFSKNFALNNLFRIFVSSETFSRTGNLKVYFAYDYLTFLCNHLLSWHEMS